MRTARMQRSWTRRSWAQAGRPCHRESGCGSVLVDESCAGGRATYWCGGLDRGLVSVVVGCSLAQAAVGPVGVVVLDEVGSCRGVGAVGVDSRSASGRAVHGARYDPSLSERVGPWSARWDGDDVGADRREDAIEGSGALACAITDHETPLPSDHRRRFHDQHHLVEASPVKGARQHREYGAAGGCT